MIDFSRVNKIKTNKNILTNIYYGGILLVHLIWIYLGKSLIKMKNETPGYV